MKQIILTMLFFIIFSFNNCSSSLNGVSNPPVDLSSRADSANPNSKRIGDVIVNFGSTLSDTYVASMTANSILTDINIELWPNGELKYFFDETITDSNIKTNFVQACKLWAASTNNAIKCTEVKTKTSGFPYELIITTSTSPSDCFVDLGASTMSTMSLGADCATPTKILHLVGHSLGLIDEHLRVDRDRYVQVPMIGDESLQYIKLTSHKLQMTSNGYNYSSVMHHSFTNTFTANPLTLRAFGNVNINAIGNATTVTSDAILSIKNMYPSTNATQVVETTCSHKQTVNWGPCYANIDPSTPNAKNNDTMTVYNQNSNFSKDWSNAKYTCLNGYWSLASEGTCVATQTQTDPNSVNSKCSATAAVSWGDSKISSRLCTSPINLAADADPGKIIITFQTSSSGVDLGLGIFVCKNGNWTFQNSYVYPFSGINGAYYNDTLGSTKYSYCYQSSNPDECAVGDAGSTISWNGTSGTTPSSCNASLSVGPLAVGATTVLYSKDANHAVTGAVNVTCAKDAAGNKKLVINPLINNTAGSYCGYYPAGSTTPNPVNITSQMQAAVCSKTTSYPNVTWNETSSGSTCSQNINVLLDRDYFDGEIFVVRNRNTTQSFNSTAAFKCTSGTDPKLKWQLVSATDINNSAGLIPQTVCKSICRPILDSNNNPWNYYWKSLSTQTPISCGGKLPDSNRSYVEGETMLISNTLIPTSSADSQIQYKCSYNPGAATTTSTSSSVTNTNITAGTLIPDASATSATKCVAK